MRAVFEGADIFKKSVKALSALVDEAEFLFDGEGMKLRAIDPAQIAMVDFLLPRHAFKEYDVEGPVKVGLNLKDLRDILKNAKAHEEVVLSVSDDCARFVVERVGGTACKRYTLPVLDLGVAEPPLPNLPSKATVRVIAEVLQKALDDASIFSSYATFHADDSTFTVKASGSKGEYILELKKDVHEALLGLSVTEESKAMYSLEYLDDMVSQANKTAAVTVAFATDSPLKLSYAIGDANFTYYLAPRIE